MKKFLYCLFVLLYFNPSANAKHCPYDNAFITVLRIVDNDSNEIDGLKIYILDDSGRVLAKSSYISVYFPQNHLLKDSS
ncbi:MAG: hypothetical protein GC180_05320 [Bacteroidetes bacterium]|nr:hypothetical protein [Bacteroidota bacterium]